MRNSPTIKGIKIKGNKISKHTWNADLIEFEGPLVSLFKNEEDMDILYVWLDCDEKHHKWCILPVSRANLQGYLTQNITLLKIFRDANEIIVYDSTLELRRINFIKVEPANFPEEYLPKENSYLYPEISTEAAKRLAADLPQEYFIGLDEELYFEELGIIPRLYQQLYSFHYGLEHLSRPAVREKLENLMDRWTGGFSAVNLFTGLRSVMPSIHRSRVTELRYNSPGHVKLSLLPEMAKRIENASDRIESPEDFENFETLYKDIKIFFKNTGISGFEEERSITKESQLSDEELKQLKLYVNKFINMMHWQEHESQFTSIHAGALAQMRALLAYYRRLRQLRRFIRLNKINLGESNLNSKIPT